MVPVARGGRWRAAGTRRREGGQGARHRGGARGQWKRPCEFPLLAYNLPVLHAAICQRVAFAESAQRGLTVLETDPNGQAAQEVQALCREIREHCR